MAQAKIKHDEANRLILASLDVVGEYRSLGVEITGQQPNAKGWLACRAIDREDRNPSAAINVRTGYYVDLGAGKDGTGQSLSLWDFAAKVGRFADWREARKHYATATGVELSRGRPAKDPNDEIVPQPWNETLAALWCRTKPPITTEALRAAGGILARYPAKSEAHQVIALPVYGPRLVEIDSVGWVVWHAGGRELPVYGRGGEVVRKVKMKTVAGSKSGLMGFHGLARLSASAEGAPRLIWKVEGPTDLMALWVAIPPDRRENDLVVCNSGGAVEDVRPEIAEVFLGHRVRIVHDADRAGEAGAAKWLEALVSVASEVKQVRLPGDVAESKGVDLRDYLTERMATHTYADLCALAEAAPVFALPTQSSVAQSSVAGDPSADPVVATATDLSETRIAEALHLDVLGERDNGQVVVFASHPTRRKTVEIHDCDRLTYARLLQIAGSPVKEVVDESGEGSRDRFGTAEVRNALCYLAGRQRLGVQTLAGPGCWQATDEDGNDLPAVLIVGAGEAAVWDATAGELTQICHPRAGGRLLHLSDSEPWYDFGRLTGHLAAAADPKWAQSVIDEAMNLLGRWRWRVDRGAPETVTGLVLATWVQTLWGWRPQAGIVGGTKTGKSTLFECLAGIFGKLSIRSSKSTAAGIRQRVRTSGRVVLADEFEHSKHRDEILEMARASSRGDEVLRGTTNQRGQGYILRHLFWAAAIEIGLRRAPDRNRWIELELVPPHKADQGKLTLPPVAELRDLGQRLLAIAVRSITAARGLSVALRAVQVEGVDSRLVESYAVPAAILGVSCGFSEEESRGLLKLMLKSVAGEGESKDGKEEASDEDDLLQALLSAEVRLDKSETLSVSEILYHRGVDNMEALERHGLAVVYGRRGSRRQTAERPTKPDDEEEFLFIDHRTTGKRLLRQTPFQDLRTDTILRRISGAEKTRRRIAKRNAWGVSVPMDEVSPFLQRDDDENKEQRGNVDGTPKSLF